MIYNMYMGEIQKKEGNIMDHKEYALTVAKNLRRIAYDAGKSQADISRDLNINKATISSWMNGTRIPRMEKVDLLCHYFNVNRRDIMEEYDGSSKLVLREDERLLLDIYNLLTDDAREKAIDYLVYLKSKDKNLRKKGSSYGSVS